MKKSLNVVAGAALAACAGVTFAQISPPSGSTSPSAAPAPGASGDTFTKLDADKDGMVSKKEASRNKDLASKWDTLDSNKDGKLDQGEFAAFESGSSPGSTPKY